MSSSLVAPVDHRTDLLEIEDLTRREFVAGALAAALLVACGDDGEKPTDASTSAGFPRTVAHGLGKVTIPAKPERIVATADRDQLDVLLAMGIEPVLYGFSGDYEVAAPWVSPSLLEGVERTLMPGAFEPNLEASASATPDLIIDAWPDEVIYRWLSAIAPTMEIKVKSTTTWREAQRLAGRAAGTDAAAEAAIAETQAEIARHATRLEPFKNLKVAVASRIWTSS